MSVTPLTFFERHEELLNQALNAIETRGFWSPYSEDMRSYDEEKVKSAKADFEALLNKPFPLASTPAKQQLSHEVSPYGFALNVSYDQPDMNELVDAMEAVIPQWRDAGPKGRVGVCLEILHRLNQESALIGETVMHTSGQGPMMAFQAGSPHAQDRGLESVVYAWQQMKTIPETARWEKPQGKRDPLVMEKKFTLVPRGVALVVGCSTFPTWNTYPGLFASLVTGNPIIVKPHPAAILPAALTVKIAQEVLEEAGLSPLIITLAVDTQDEPVTKELALNPKVKVIDYTGSSAFGNWLEDNAKQAKVFTEKAGVNSIIIDSLDNLKAVTSNLAFTISLFSGQMCTTTQAIYVPKTGINTPEGKLSPEDFAKALAEATEKFLSDDMRASMVLGAVNNPATKQRIADSHNLGKVMLASRKITHPHFPEAEVHSPVILLVDAKDKAAYAEERFGPIAFVVACDDTDAAIATAKEVLLDQGAITLGFYTTDDEVMAKAEELGLETKVALSFNLDGGVFVNQSAAFSDYHGTGGNPAANACLTDAAFLASRYMVVQTRRHI